MRRAGRGHVRDGPRCVAGPPARDPPGQEAPSGPVEFGSTGGCILVTGSRREDDRDGRNEEGSKRRPLPRASTSRLHRVCRREAFSVRTRSPPIAGTQTHSAAQVSRLRLARLGTVRETLARPGPDWNRDSAKEDHSASFRFGWGCAEPAPNQGPGWARGAATTHRKSVGSDSSATVLPKAGLLHRQNLTVTEGSSRRNPGAPGRPWASLDARLERSRVRRLASNERGGGGGGSIAGGLAVSCEEKDAPVRSRRRRAADARPHGRSSRQPAT